MSCASDIPETYATPSAMARTLSSYIECPHRVRALVCEHFGLSRGLSVETIRRMRERHLRPAPMVSAPTSPWSAQEESDKLAAANDRFVAALQAARRA